MNRYGFAAGDPVNYSDPLGLCPKDMGGDGKSENIADCPDQGSGCQAGEDAKNEGTAGGPGRIRKRDASARCSSCIEDTPGIAAMAALSVLPMGNMKLTQGFRMPGSSPFTSIDRRFPWLPFAKVDGGAAVRTVARGALTKTAGTLGTIGAVVGTFATSYSLTTIARCAIESTPP